MDRNGCPRVRLETLAAIVVLRGQITRSDWKPLLGVVGVPIRNLVVSWPFKVIWEPSTRIVVETPEKQREHVVVLVDVLGICDGFLGEGCFRNHRGGGSSYLHRIVIVIRLLRPSHGAGISS